MIKRIFADIAISFIVISAAAPIARADIVNVNVFDFEFSVNPPDARVVDPVIDVGDTIRWVWVFGFHDTNSVAGSVEVWSSPTTDEVGTTFDHTFTNVGEFPYYCSIHGFDNGDGTAGGMSGVITVVPEPVTLTLLSLAGAWLLRIRRAEFA